MVHRYILAERSNDDPSIYSYLMFFSYREQESKRVTIRVTHEDFIYIRQRFLG